MIVNGLRSDEFAEIVPAEGAKDIVYMGMLRDLKGPDILIRAIARIRDRSGAAPSVAMIGEGPDRDACERLAADLGLAGQVSFHAPRPTREGLAMGRLMVVPSRAESMPYVVLESVAAGLPMIASKVGGIPEIVGPRSGELVPPGDVDALADAIEAALAAPAAAKARALAARRALRERFTVAMMTENVESLYLSALAQRRAQQAGALVTGLQPAE